MYLIAEGKGAQMCHLCHLKSPGIPRVDGNYNSYFIFRTPEVKYPGKGQAHTGPDVASVSNSVAKDEQRVGKGYNY